MNCDAVGNYIYTSSDGVIHSEIIYHNGETCLINETIYNNDTDENVRLDGNLYIQDPTRIDFADYL
jgi:hypothetical protein